jgi:hypothetical protein
MVWDEESIRSQSCCYQGIGVSAPPPLALEKLQEVSQQESMDQRLRQAAMEELNRH